ncbi:MAG: AAA family ATPase, partial [Actinomycetota bacterium]|nr:AAA family ATPase [Actinomycetota bacterium]
MGQQPSGTVTFLFSDIEGSTVLLRELGTEQYAQALDEHRRLLRTAFDRHHGYEVDCEGDAFFVAFQSASAAIQAAAEAQEGTASHAWPDGTELRIRIGLHTGEPLLAPPKYVGMDVHKAARIMSAGHGGQVLLSQTTRDLIGEEPLPLCDLGEHRFKDLATPERVYQLGEGEFPALKTLYRSNFPVPATQFLGRERELSTIVGMINDPGTRLLTLTGPGGTGKTRLALQAAAEAADAFPDGMTWVPLAPVREPAHALSAVAQALEVREEPGAPLIESLTRALTDRTTLLLLDNAEHLLPDVADDSAALLTACPALRLLVTSRERLQVQSETVWPVPQLAESEGERLFVERARALEPSFVPTAAVADLCRALDELPLAIELAAARCVVFSPDQLIERLGQRLD